MSGFYKYAEAEPDFVAVVDPDGTEFTKWIRSGAETDGGERSR